MTDRPARLRFAPSPTGPLHLGGARTALYNWAAARALGGQFILRIEDTDQARSTEASLRFILEGLRWLGIDWDEGPEKGGAFGPYFQMERRALYQRTAQRLVEDGKAYPCYCTAEEIESGRKQLEAAGQKSMYDRRCRELSVAERHALEAEGRRPSIRARLPLDLTLVIKDHCKGDVEVNTRELDDWVMVRQDGVPLYNFACVVDDAEMQITHVVRGEEHFMNGFKQVLLFRELLLTPPEYAHIPLILGKDGKKLSKREASTNVLEYRDNGYPPDAVFNYIATLGWGFSGDRDIFSRSEMIERFTIDQIGRSGAKFDEEKLLAICGDYVRRMPLPELLATVRPFVVASSVLSDAAFESQPGFVQSLVAVFQERFRIYTELPDKLRPFVSDVSFDDGALKSLAKFNEAPSWLAAYRDALVQLKLPPSWPADRSRADAYCPLPQDKSAVLDDDPEFMTPFHLEQHARAFVERLGVKFGHFVHPVRAALTGTTAGPGLFDCVWLLGRERCLERLEAGAKHAAG